MGIQLEVREKVICLDLFCVARGAIEAALEEIGININSQVERTIEEHLEKLVQLLNEEIDDSYTFTVPLPSRDLKITIHNIQYDATECYVEGCEGYVTAVAEIEADVNTMREIAKAIIRSMGIDKYVKCE
jgi:hypothetical protein